MSRKTLEPKASQEPQETRQNNQGFTAEGYEVPQNEIESVHVEIEKPIFNTLTGEKISKSIIHKTSPREYQRDKDHLNSLGWKIIQVLHYPASASNLF